jgi:hypothetical protein
LIFEVYAALARAMIEDTVRLAREWVADVVVWDSITFAGGIAARVCGAVSVRHTWGWTAPSSRGSTTAGHRNCSDYDVLF